jgi:alpha-acetolactate decarboxylase
VPTVRYVFHIADAPAHGGEFDTGESQKGCTCGISTDAVIHAINVKEIHYRLIKVTHNAKLDKMGKHFQKLMTNYEETTIQKANELDVRVSDMVMRELLPDA